MHRSEAGWNSFEIFVADAHRCKSGLAYYYITHDMLVRHRLPVQ